MVGVGRFDGSQCVSLLGLLYSDDEGTMMLGNVGHQRNGVTFQRHFCTHTMQHSVKVKQLEKSCSMEQEADGEDSYCGTVLSGRRVQALRGIYCLQSEAQRGLGENIICIYTTLTHALKTLLRPEDGGSRFVQNVDTHLPVHTVS